MTSSADCREIRHALGVYVLGAIDPAERSLVDNHLSTCPECREELAGLAGLPALLRRVPVAEAVQIADDSDDDDLPGTEMPSDRVLESLLARTTRARQARRWRGLAAAAAVVLVAGVGGAVGYGAVHQPGTRVDTSNNPAPAHFTSATATNPQTHVTAVVRYAPKNWGTVLDTQVIGVPSGVRCQLVVTDSAGHSTVVGGWKTTYDEGTTWYPGASSVAMGSVHSFQVTSQGKVLVTIPVH
jgi:anti-sigma factor RsiW